MVRRVGSPTCIVHADVTLIRSKVKVKVMGLPKFRESSKIMSISSIILAKWWLIMKLWDEMEFTILEFPSEKLSRAFKLRGMSILHELQRAIFPYCLRTESHGRVYW